MTLNYRLSQAADRDYKDILTWSEDKFGQAAMERYDALLEAALLHAAQRKDGIGFRQRPEFGAGVVSWHIANSVNRSTGGKVKSPHHVLYCRWDDEVLVVGRILGDVMEADLHIRPDMDWD